MATLYDYEAAVDELHRRRARVTAAAEVFIKGELPLGELEQETTAAREAERSVSATRAAWHRTPFSALTASEKALLAPVHLVVEEQLAAAMKAADLDPLDAAHVVQAQSHHATRALVRALRALDVDLR
jgi:predicted glycosyltransferase